KASRSFWMSLESGNDRSRSMTSIPPWLARASAAARVSTRSSSNCVHLASASATSIRRASPGLSSTSRTRTAGFSMVPLLRRQFHQRQPEVLDRFDELQELVEVHRLGEVAVDVQVVRLEDFSLRLLID